MATTENRLSKVISEDGKSQVIVKLTISRNQRPCFKSGVFVNPKYFKPIKETARGSIYGIVPPKKSKLNFIDVKEVTDAKNKLNGFTNKLLRICQVAEDKNKDNLTKSWLDEALKVTNDIASDEITYNIIIDRLQTNWVNADQATKNTFFGLMDEYLKDTKYSDVREKNFRVLIRALKRYETFIRLYDKKRNTFTLDIETIDKDTISDIESFLRNEHTLLEQYPHIFKKFPVTTDIRRKSPKPKPRGNNTICALFNKLRAFFNWCNDQKITQNRPFAGYNGVTSEKYGTPYYITIEERNQIADFDLSEHPHLAIQRDIFIFQCLIGCRVSDLLKMTEKNIINEAVEYIPHKTRDERPTIVRVPLNDRAHMLVDKYKGMDAKGRLFPFISAQKYNDDIKDIFRLCGITRFVTVLNPTTGEEEKRPIDEVASSHMARRTFVGNLYKKVKDPNLVGSLSGHAEGSKAFARYREIDEEMKKELVNMIE